MKYIFCLSVCLFSSASLAQDNIITIYQDGSAYINENQEIDLVQGRNILKYSNLPHISDENFLILSVENANVKEKSYQPENSLPSLISTYDNLEVDIESHVGDRVVINSGKLVSYSPNEVSIIEDGKLITILDFKKLSIKNLDPALLNAKAEFTVDANKAMKTKSMLSYFTNDLNWQASTLLYYQPKKGFVEGMVTVKPMVSIQNNSNKNFPNTKLSLIAGELNKVYTNVRGYKAMAMEASVASDANFAGSELAEYHEYNLKNTVNLVSKSNKQLAMYEDLTPIPAKIRYEYDVFKGQNVLFYLNFENKNLSKEPIYLPPSKTKVFINNKFIGEDSLAPISKDQKVEVKLGSANDIKVKRKILNSTTDNPAKTRTETIELEFENLKDSIVPMEILEHLNGGNNWKVLKSTAPFEKVDDTTIKFKLDLKAKGKTVVSYDARYEW